MDCIKFTPGLFFFFLYGCPVVQRESALVILMSEQCAGDVVAYVYSPGTQEVQAGRLGVQNHSQIHCVLV